MKKILFLFFVIFSSCSLDENIDVIEKSKKNDLSFKKKNTTESDSYNYSQNSLTLTYNVQSNSFPTSNIYHLFNWNLNSTLSYNNLFYIEIISTMNETSMLNPIPSFIIPLLTSTGNGILGYYGYYTPTPNSAIPVMMINMNQYKEFKYRFIYIDALTPSNNFTTNWQYIAVSE